MKKLLAILLVFLCACSKQEVTIIQSKDLATKLVKDLQSNTQLEVVEEEIEEEIDPITIIQPTYGEIYAHITCERLGLDKDIYYGDDEVILKKALGQYDGSHLFGEGNVILVAGHNGTHFKAIHKVEVGDQMVVKTSYGIFTYEVYDTRVRYASDFTFAELDANEERLIMYTCYPFNSLSTNRRFFVTCRLIDRQPLEENNG